VIWVDPSDALALADEVGLVPSPETADAIEDTVTTGATEEVEGRTTLLFSRVNV
jgi:predicted alternative tryptophan synthase beta-subunit